MRAIRLLDGEIVSQRSTSYAYNTYLPISSLGVLRIGSTPSFRFHTSTLSAYLIPTEWELSSLCCRVSVSNPVHLSNVEMN